MMKSRRGFTLVEVIVVLVILAILAAIIIPSMTGWIDKANEQKYIADARLVYVAAQSAISEQYGVNPNFSSGIKYDESGGQGSKYGRVSNSILYDIQQGKTITNPSQKVDAAIATQVLAYLDSSTYSTARYKMETRTRPVGGSSPDNVTDYCKSNKNQPGIIIVYDATGTVVYVEFGYESYLVHIDKNGLVCTKDGTFSPIANGSK